MELNKEHILKFEVLTLSKSALRQLRYWSGESLKEFRDKANEHVIEVVGWCDFEGTWVIMTIDGHPGKCRSTDYVVACVDRELWRDGTTLQVMDKFPQVFVK
jgi:hypothetical protein